ncbi:MAG: phage late control D family protein [Deltaproteobacteria bacterium]|nr:MAG: phage late control D family protein [Deltaproteobacteria bacterium]
MADEHNKAHSFTITVSGNESTQSHTDGVESMFVEEHLDMVGMAQITYATNSKKAFSSYKVGDEVEVKLAGSARLWKGFITGFRVALEGNEPKMTVIAMDALCKLASSRHTRVWPADGNNAGSEKVKDDTIVNEVLSDAGVTVGEVGAGIESKYVFQRNESDLNFLKRLAARNGFVLRVVEGKVNFEPLPTGGESVTVDYKTCKALDFTWSPMWVPPTMKVHGYDYATKTRVNGEHSSFAAIGKGQDPVAYGTSQIWQKESHISDLIVTTDSGAKALAEAELERVGRNFLRGRAIVDGSAEFHPGMQISFTGFNDLNTTAVIVSTRHIISSKPEDFRTEITFQSNTAPS